MGAIIGLPKITIAFKTAGITAIQRGQRGIVALILKDGTNHGAVKMVTVEDIPETLSAANKEQIKLAMMGTMNPPKRVIAYILPTSAATYNEALSYLEGVKWDYLAIPEISDADKGDIAIWIKQMRDTSDRKVKAVLPNQPADHEGIINFATESIVTAVKTYSAREYCARMAGILAGMPLTISATYQVLPEVMDVPHLTEDELNTMINSGMLLLFNDGEKVKIARAVNSFVTTTQDKGDDFRKIKIVDILDIIHDDIKKTAEDSYIGKFANSYDNKCLLVSAIQAYFEALELDGLLDKGKNRVYIDIPVQRNYLKGTGVDVDEMNEQEIKEANTKDKVFLAASIKPLDAVEEIKLDVTL